MRQLEFKLAKDVFYAIHKGQSKEKVDYNYRTYLNNLDKRNYDIDLYNIVEKEYKNFKKGGQNDRNP